MIQLKNLIKKLDKIIGFVSQAHHTRSTQSSAAMVEWNLHLG